MKLTKRDKAIIADLNRFRVMDRDSIAELHFNNLKDPTYAANTVLLRLTREEQIQRSESFTPYVYFGPEVSMKKNSAKIGHFLAILNVYKEILKHGKVDTFQVEPKYIAKGEGAEPDIFCIFRRTPFFIEVQKTIYSEKQMSDKLDRYVDLYESGVIAGEPWQPSDKKVFPHVLILSEQRYPIDNNYPFRVVQAQSFTQFLNSLKPKEQRVQEPIKVQSNNGSIKLNIN
ncbi:hypothetical protein [Cytobacillus luteolus]|uniref:hypothetical protein n=1 Tax=Litchfieldia luteola TaxID=682179 RepID=UPI001AE9A927|nr:hypothetical protein [Cytobacillus luteolus]MBP1944651.1 hypothetical protein [Cytobacillus luteolus]